MGRHGWHLKLALPLCLGAVVGCQAPPRRVYAPPNAGPLPVAPNMAPVDANAPVEANAAGVEPASYRQPRPGMAQEAAGLLSRTPSHPSTSILATHQQATHQQATHQQATHQQVEQPPRTSPTPAPNGGTAGELLPTPRPLQTPRANPPGSNPPGSNPPESNPSGSGPTGDNPSEDGAAASAPPLQLMEVIRSVEDAYPMLLAAILPISSVKISSHFAPAQRMKHCSAGFSNPTKWYSSLPNRSSWMTKLKPRRVPTIGP